MPGLRAVLLTDVVDSTALAARVGDAAAAAIWAAHDRAARDLLRRWRGREIDKSDGMLTLFDDAGDAVSFAIAYHAALAAPEIGMRARAGLHVGAVALRENPADDVALGAKPVEVDGIAKSIAARVMSMAAGGQTLLTETARAGLDGRGLAIRSHGWWRAKGLAEPFEVFEACPEDAAPLPPPPGSDKVYRVVRQGDLWLPAAHVPHHLHAERDAFVGRGAALEDLARRLGRGARLLSIVGIGGCGKTRLATRFAWQWLGDFPGGVWFCDLAQARDVDGIVHAVGEALDVPLGRGDPVARLGEAIAGRGRCLVVLDNFEQVSRYAEDTIGRWLMRAPEARFLVTTREVLGLAGEEAFALAPLAAEEAQALFVERAAAAGRGFRSSVDDESAIATLVRLLDGLPLAIELAAARVRVMPPQVLLARMSDRFRLLASAGGRRDRQATLRAAFDWSWDLLGASDKAALAQLSVFEGGFTLGAAEAVLDLSNCSSPPWVVDALQSLVDKSFVRVVSDDRFDLLQSVRDYACEQLRTPGRFDDSGPQAELDAQARHARHFAGLNEAEAIAGRCVELDNLLVGCRHAITRGDAAAAVGLLENAWAGLRLRGPFGTAVDLAEQVGRMPRLTPAQLAAAHCTAGIALDAAGRTTEARARLEQALAQARAAGARRCEARTLANLGNLARTEGRVDDGRACLGAALDLAVAAGDRTLQCELHNALGSLHIESGRIEAARAEYETALAIAREIGDRRWEGGALGNLATLHTSAGRMDLARRDYEAAIEIARETGNRQWEGNMLCNLGFLHLTQCRLDEAKAHFEASLPIARQLGHPRLECIVLGNLGIVFDQLAQRGPARAHYEAALAVARRIGEPRYEGQFLSYLGLLLAREGQHEESRRTFDNGDGLLRQVDDRISLGVLLCARAESEMLGGRPQAAQAALAEAKALATEAGVGAESEFGIAVARTEALVARQGAG